MPNPLHSKSYNGADAGASHAATGDPTKGKSSEQEMSRQDIGKI